MQIKVRNLTKKHGEKCSVVPGTRLCCIEDGSPMHCGSEADVERPEAAGPVEVDEGVERAVMAPGVGRTLGLLTHLHQICRRRDHTAECSWSYTLCQYILAVTVPI